MFMGIAAPSRPLTVREALIEDRAAWDRFTLERASGNLPQCWGMGEAAAARGWQVDRLVAADERRPMVGAMQIVYRPARGGVTIAYSCRGPAVECVESDDEVVSALVGRARRLARTRRALVLKLDPMWRADLSQTGHLLARLHARPSTFDLQHRLTFILDVSSGADELLARLPRKTRHHVHRAERAGVEITIGSDPDAVASFQMLSGAMTARRGGSDSGSEYYMTFLREVGRSCPVAVLLALVDGQPVRGMIVAAAGPRLCYLFAGSSETHGNLQPAYLLQWRAILWGLSHGCRFYDLWGIPADEDPEQPRSGWAAFKARWGGTPVRYAGGHDVPLWPVPQAVSRCGENLSLRGGSFFDVTTSKARPRERRTCNP